MLSHMIGSHNWRQVLVFTRTKHGANRLAQQLEKDGLGAAAIHGNKSQGARTRALAGFKNGTVRVLVATDIAARGLDIDQLPHVVNYELPNVPEDYVHRIGRTGRAGKEGAAVSLVCVDEHRLLRDIERLLKGEIPKVVLQGYEPDPSIQAEPILNGRNGQGRSQPRKQAEGRSRNRSSAGRSANAPRESGSDRSEKKRTASKPANKHIRRKSNASQAKPQHRHPRSGHGGEKAAPLGGGFRDD
jgi:ATP-dependent RNA helicase RhlE